MTDQTCPNCQFPLGSNAAKCDCCRVFRLGVQSSNAPVRTTVSKLALALACTGFGAAVVIPLIVCRVPRGPRPVASVRPAAKAPVAPAVPDMARMFLPPLPPAPASAPAVAAASESPSDPDVLPPKALRRLGSRRFRSLTDIACAKLAPQGDVLASTSLFGKRDQVHLVEVPTGRILRTLQADGDQLLFSPDGRLLAVVDSGDVQLFDRASGTQLAGRTAQQVRANSLAFSANGAALAWAPESNGSMTQLHVMDIATGRQIGFPCPQTEPLIALSPDSRQLVTVGLTVSDPADQRDSGQASGALVWDVATGRQVKSIPLVPPVLEPFAVAMSPDGKLLAVGGTNSVVVLDLPNGTTRYNWGSNAADGGVLRFSPKGDLLACGGSDGSVQLWNAKNGQIVTFSHGPKVPVSSVEFPPDGRVLAQSVEEHSIPIWDARNGLRYNEGIGHRFPILSVAFTPDGSLFSSAGDGIRRWDPATGTLLALTDAGDTTLSGHNQIERISRAGKYRTVLERNQLALQEIGQPATVLGNISGLLAVKFSADESLLVTVSAQRNAYQLVTWNLPERRRSSPIEFRSQTAPRIEVAANGTLVALLTGQRVTAGFVAQNLTLLDVRSGSRRLVEPTRDLIQALAISPDGATVLVADQQGRIRKLNAAGQLVGPFGSPDTPLKLKGIESLTFSADGRQVAIYCNPHGDGHPTVSVVDTVSGRWTLEEAETGAFVNAAAFSPDGKLLAAGLSDSTVMLWRVP